jgi:hypothetical protein
VIEKILKRYLDNVAPRVDMKEEKEIAERYLMEINNMKHKVKLETAN